jgi:predicted O-methyltransferase YrrM
LDKFRLIRDYYNYRKNAVTKYKIHSPFVYDFITKLMEDKTVFQAYSVGADLRESLVRDHSAIEVVDFGAAAHQKAYDTYFRKISDIAKRAGQRKKYAELLFRLVHFYAPANIFELGTSLGMTTAQFALANPRASITSIEGCSATASIARTNFNKLNIKNIEILIGNFEQILPRYLKNTKQLDFVLFDGNHRKEPTLKYFEQCLPKAHNDSIFVFDDIYWSAGMKEAWEQIKLNPKVKLSIDLFQFGIVFFRKELTKQDFVLKY